MHELVMRQVPVRLKGKIARRVEDEGSNMNDVLVKILADAYGVPFTPTGNRPRRKIGQGTQILLELPEELKTRIAVDAAANRETQRNTAMRLIAAEFGEPFTPTGRRERPPTRHRTAVA